MTEIKKYDFRLFSVEVCENCFSYRFDHKKNLVFHGISTNHLSEQTPSIITPKGDSEVPYYGKYIGKRSLHLGPLEICGPLQKTNQKIWFGFNVNKLKPKYPQIRYMNYSIWEQLGFHSGAFSESEEQERHSKLFLPDYSIEPVTEILLPELDCSLAQIVVARTPELVKKAEAFAGKNLESTIFDLETAKSFWDDWINNLDVKCECTFN